MKHWVQPAAWQASLGKLPCCRSTPTKRAEAFQTILHKVGWAKGIESFRHRIQHIDLNFVMVTLSENNQTWLLEIMVCCFQIFSCSCYFENKYNYFLDKEGLCRKERISVMRRSPHRGCTNKLYFRAYFFSAVVQLPLTPTLFVLLSAMIESNSYLCHSEGMGLGCPELPVYYMGNHIFACVHYGNVCLACM